MILLQPFLNQLCKTMLENLFTELSHELLNSLGSIICLLGNSRNSNFNEPVPRITFEFRSVLDLGFSISVILFLVLICHLMCDQIIDRFGEYFNICFEFGGVPSLCFLFKNVVLILVLFLICHLMCDQIVDGVS